MECAEKRLTSGDRKASFASQPIIAMRVDYSSTFLQIDIEEFFDIAAEAAGFVNRNHLYLWLNSNPNLGLEWVQFVRELTTHFPSWYSNQARGR